MTTPSNTPDASALGEAWVDGMPLTNLIEALRLNPDETPAQRTHITQRFWSTPARAASSPLQETMQVTLSSARMINYVSFEVSNFPTDISLEYFDSSVEAWVPVLDGSTVHNEPAQQSILDSIPGIIPSVIAVSGHVHPQHSFAGHWKFLEFPSKPFVAKEIRLVLRRTDRGVSPVTVLGAAIDYSLAVRNLYLGYKVRSRSDVPRTEPLDGQRRQYASFASATDVLGSTLQYSLRVNRASSLLDSSDSTAVWKCNPQPVPWAVVNLYVDTRDLQGNGQLIDRFLIDPLYDGVSFNLYWSTDEPSGQFAADEDLLAFPVASTYDEANLTVDVLHAGPANLGKVGFVDIDNKVVGFDPSRPWWIGGLLGFKFEHGSQNVATPLVDFGEFLIAMTPFGPRITTRYGDTLLVPTDPMAIGTPFHFVAGYDGATLSLWVRQGSVHYSGSLMVTVPLSQATMAPAMRFGGFHSTSPGVADLDLTALVVKVDETPTEEISEAFFEDYSEFIQGESTHNALLRYHSSFSTSNYREAFIGGPADRYESMVWNPIARDFVLRKGYLSIPPTNARYWKFEFCGLVPQPYEVFNPIRRTIQTFQPDMWIPQPDPATMQASIRQLFPGVLASISEGVTSNYRDAAVAITGTGGTTKGYTATTARVIRNTEIRGAVSQKYFVWNYLPMHSGTKIPCFQSSGVHVYDSLTVEHVQKVGYFVGLRSIQPYRVDYASTDDTAEYVETFDNGSNISAQGNWILDDGHMQTGNARYAEARSNPFRSNRVVRAVQFATQQSDPIQALPDDDFVDPDHSSWSPVGDATLAPELTTHRVLGTMLRVDRAPQPGKWGSVDLLADSFGDLEDVSYGSLDQPTTVGATIGGLTSVSVPVPFGGQVHVAGRVLAPADLSEPLHVQIVDGATDRVLADAEIEVTANKVTEWYASYSINDLQPPSVWQWGDFSATQLGPTMNDDFIRTNSSTLGVMRSGHPWKTGPNGSLVISSNMAVTSIEGNSNYVDTYSPWGTLEIEFGNVGTGSSGKVKAFEFDPISVLTDGTVCYSGGAGLSVGSVLTTNDSPRSIQNNDVIKVEILPSRYVPADKADVTFTPRDDIVRPYSCMIYLNGTWVRTLSHEHGSRSRRAIYGRINQQVTGFRWTPKAYGKVWTPTITRYPRQNYGDFADSLNRTFVDGEGYSWTADGSWDISTAVEVANDATYAAPLTAASNGAVFAVDTVTWHGSLTAYVRNVATTAVTDVKHGMVFCLDYDAGVFVDYAGDVVDKTGVNYGNLFTGGITTGRYTIQWAKTALVNAAHRSSIDPEVHPEILIGKLNGTFVKAFAHVNLPLWTGTKRGIAGDLYDPAGGSRPAVANYTIDTSFRSFNWSPDAYHTPNVSGPTWGNVTREDTATYGSAILGRSPDFPQLSARIVQFGITNDLWFVDTLSMFVDPIMWYFSNDGGTIFYPALNIRNNPNGVLLFPSSTEMVSANQVPGTSLVWKVMAYAPECNVSHLVVRPWYGSALSAITHQVGIGGGPDVMPYDQYTDLRRDARFQTWSKPIPQSWWYAYRTIRPPLPDTIPTGPDLHLSPEIVIDSGE